jgi:hypothetical protein
MLFLLLFSFFSYIVSANNEEAEREIPMMKKVGVE